MRKNGKKIKNLLFAVVSGREFGISSFQARMENIGERERRKTGRNEEKLKEKNGIF